MYSRNGYLLFDDSVLDKSGSKKIKLARWQYSRIKHDTVIGVGVVNCVYYNPKINRYWVIDARIYQPDEACLLSEVDLCPLGTSCALS